MPRELRPELEALIATGHCNCHTTVDIELTGSPHQQQHAYTTPGDYSWTAPPDVTSVLVECWGSGGNGASHHAFGNGGGGGGGGAYGRSTLTVTPGNSYAVHVDSSTATNSEPSTTSFGGGTIYAESGNAGVDNAAVGALGGQAANSLGDFVRSGGAGGVGLLSDVVGGGGGGAAGPSGNGGNASSYHGGDSSAAGGGNGGNGEGPGPGYASPTPGTAPGGGGGGDNGEFAGQAGAGGKVLLTFSVSALDLHLSSGEVFVNRFGVTRQYLAKLKDVQSLDMSLAPEVDQLPFTAANADMVIGQTLTGPARRLDGARGTVGALFIDPDDPDITTGQHIYDAKMPGEIVAGEIVDDQVSFTLLSDVDAVLVSGRTIASEFQWREPISNAPVADPNDHPGGHGDDPPGCFVAGTMIKTPGVPLPIEIFQLGDPIMVWDFTLGKLVKSTVTDVEVHPSKLTKELTTESGRSARLTDEQPLYAGWEKLFDRLDCLRRGSALGCLNTNEDTELDRVATVGDPEYRTVHHLHVAHADHNYVLDNGIIAHNLKWFGRYGNINSGFFNPE